MKRHLLTLGLAVTLVLGGATAASAADEPDVHPEVAYALAAEPGGVVVNYYTAEWPQEGMRLEVPSDAALHADLSSDAGARFEAQLGVAARAVGSCATGSVCAYSSGGIAGAKLSWTSCGTKSTSALSTVGSIANGRTSGTLRALAGSTERASASAESYANVAASYRSLITSVSC